MRTEHVRRAAGILRHLLFAAGVAAAAGLAALNVLAWQGSLTDDTPSQEAGLETAPPAQVVSEPLQTSSATDAISRPAPLPKPTLALKPALARLTLAASGGDSYIAVRVGSASGRLLWEGVLPDGESRQFTKRRLWLRVGAANNLSLELNGEAVAPLTVLTGDVLVTATGARQLSSD